MSRALAYVEIVKSLKPIAEADRIECAEVLGWELIVKKNEFKVGDLAVYFEVDSILPEYPPFEFLRPKKFRIKTLKLKNQISQGLLLPLSVIKEIDPTFNMSKIKVGLDLTETLKVIKYDPEALDEKNEPEPVKKTWWEKKFSYFKWKLFGFKPTKSIDFPSYVPKSDEIRVQKMGSTLEIESGQSAYISEKLEGSSSTFCYKQTGNWIAKLFGNGYTYQVCSRNRIVYDSNKNNFVPTDNNFMFLSNKYKLLDKMKKLNRNLAIQGECIGPKVQGNIYRLSELELRVFLIFDIDKQEYLSLPEMLELCNQLGLQTVPILDTNHIIKNDIKYYVELAKINSTIKKDILAEGIVVRLNNKNVSFKSINLNYLLRKDK